MLNYIRGLIITLLIFTSYKISRFHCHSLHFLEITKVVSTVPRLTPLLLRCLYLLIGQGLIVQGAVSCPLPVHSPPYLGAGLSHSRVLTFIPGPQVALHTVQDSHWPHFPSTNSKVTTQKHIAFEKNIYKIERECNQEF